MNERPAGDLAPYDRIRNALSRSRLLVAASAALWLLSSLHAIGRADPPKGPELARQDREGCSKNLKTIYAAIEAYRKDHKDLPKWFSDLVPDYLPDPNVLMCPICRRTGQIEGPPLADPRIASSYLYEFCPVPLGGQAPGNPKATRREWKERQMALVGPIVPIVRCRHHQPVLNLAYDGHLYDSTPAWESMLTNQVDPQSLTPGRIFPASSSTNPAVAKKSYPARDPKTGPELIDLTAYYNARLTDSWHGGENATGNDLGSIASGVKTLGGTDFDLRGLIQLAGSGNTGRFPSNLAGIKVNQKCRKIHFLHSAAWGKVPDEGKLIGTYVLHFSANNMRLEVPIIYGKDVRDWHYWRDEQEPPPGLKLVWQGENATSKAAKSYLRLFETTWTNVVPEIELESIDFVSSMASPAPFLLAITLE